MPKMIVVHDVEDVDAWLRHKDERAGAIGAMGATNVVDHVAQDASRTVAITAETDDAEAIVAQIASPAPEVLEAMGRHGVVPPLKVFVER